MEDPIGPDNDQHIMRILRECKARNGIAFVGWGNHGVFMGRAARVSSLASVVGLQFHCLGITKSGQPRHPLYVLDNAPLEKWRPLDN